MRALVFAVLASCGPEVQPTVSIAAPSDHAPVRDVACSDDDSDGDGILDACDRCPSRAETVNGVDDDDGCPDEKTVRILQASMRIVSLVVFPENAIEPSRESTAVLDALTEVIRSHPEFERIGLVGYAAPGEKDRDTLALARAARVMALLVQRGISADRLEARGGGSLPFQSEERYVRAWVVRASGKETARWTGSTYDSLDTKPRDPKCPLGPISGCAH